MTNITIQDLQKADSITELENRELNVTNGGIAPVVVAGIIIGSGVAGIGVGFGTAYVIDHYIAP